MIAWAEDIKDIKPPVYFPADYTLLLIIGVITLLACLVFLAFLLLKKLKKKKVKPVSSPKPAHQIAYEALETLRAKNLIQSGKIKEYYYELSLIVRRYLENRFDIRAPEMTTEEFLGVLRYSADLLENHKNLLKEFLSKSDMVKFAKYGPNQQEIEESLASAKRLIDETRIKEGGIAVK